MKHELRVIVLAIVTVFALLWLLADRGDSQTTTPTTSCAAIIAGVCRTQDGNQLPHPNADNNDANAFPTPTTTQPQRTAVGFTG